MIEIRPNKNQQIAIDTINGPVLISAGPGTGKTATLVKRYFNMVKNHQIKSDNILMATFTEKAAKEIITRISSVLPNFDLNDVYIGTFHSICLRLVRDNIACVENVRKNFTLMDDFDQKYFIYQRFNWEFRASEYFDVLPWGNRGIWDQVSMLTGWLNGLAENQIEADDILDDSDPEVVALGAMKKIYDRLLQEQNCLDFSTIQSVAYKLLNDNEHVLNHYQKLFQYIMIDEYQDTNSIQENIITLLSKSQNICVVGDDDQSMYRFRGATIRNILEFPSKFPLGKCKIIKLTINYRSSPEIIHFYNKWMTNYSEEFFYWNKFRLEKKIEPFESRTKKLITSPVLKISGETVDEWCESIHNFIINMKSNGHIDNYNQIAFLFRSVTNERARYLANYLDERNIPVYSPRSKMFFERREIKAAIGLILHLFSDYEEKLLEEDATWILEMTRYYDTCLDVAYELMDEDSQLESWISYRMEELANLKGSTNYSFTRLLYQLFSFDYFRNIIDTDLLSEVSNQRSIRNLSILTNVFAKFEAIEQINVISSGNKFNTLNKLFKTYFRFLKNGGIEEYQDESEYAPSGCVSFLTIHQSKGLEFPIVLTDSLYDIPTKERVTLLDKVYENYSQKEPFEPEDDIKYFDFWRRYYVAFSRAEDLLILTTPINSSGRSQSPSKYFSTAWNSIPNYDLKQSSFEGFHFNKVKSSELKHSYAFTSDISKYERCSLEYKMFRELNFPEIRVGSTLFGSLVHQTIEDIHNAILKNETDSINDNIESWFEQNYNGLVLTENSYLAPYVKDKALEYVRNYFINSESMWGNIREAEVQLSYAMDGYILNGQVDVLRGNGNTIEIVDFKTGDKPSDINDKMIKSYEKQLQVYAHLVEKKYDVTVSKMKLYYLSASEDPIIEFDKDSKRINEMISDFSNTIQKIERKEFNTLSNDIKLCSECDMRYFCGKSSPIR